MKKEKKGKGLGRERKGERKRIILCNSGKTRRWREEERKSEERGKRRKECRKVRK